VLQSTPFYVMCAFIGTKKSTNMSLVPCTTKDVPRLGHLSVYGQMSES
jgi:hypothetical protein